MNLPWGRFVKRQPREDFAVLGQSEGVASLLRKEKTFISRNPHR
jgi:hypothetical protein